MLFFHFRVVSIATVFVNKTLLSSQTVALEAPLFITWFQCIVSFTICSLLSKSGGIPGVFVFPKGSPYQIETVRKVSFCLFSYTKKNYYFLKHSNLAIHFLQNFCKLFPFHTLCYKLTLFSSNSRFFDASM